MSPRLPFAALAFICVTLAAADEIDLRFPLDPQLKVLSDDVKSASYRQLVLEKMLITDLAAEWQRVATVDNADSFLEKHGGKDKVLADPGLKKAYERRLKIREDYLELMREGYRRYKKPAPFDQGVKAELAGTTVRPMAAAATALAIMLPSPGAERRWPRFRGPSGQGETDNIRTPMEWGKNERNILWRTKVNGAGNSSPVIWDDHIFLTSAEENGARRFVHCFRGDGVIRWTREVPARSPEPGVRDKNGFATATSVTDGERVISFLGSCGLVCHDFEGNLIWQHDAMTVKTTHGTGSSPILYRDLVILAQDQNQADSLFLGLDKRTGKEVWRSKRPRAMSWTTPIVVRVGDHDELVIAGGETIRGYDPATGAELWSMSGPTQEVVPAIVIGKDMLYSASGRNGPTLGFRPGGKGDVTSTHLIWRAVRGGPHVPTPALVKGRLYVANDTGILSSLDAATGKLIYQERVEDRFSASPIVVGDLLYFAAESGITYVLRAGDTLDIVARNDLGSPILASPAALGGRLYIRTQNELICIGQR